MAAAGARRHALRRVHQMPALLRLDEVGPRRGGGWCARCRAWRGAARCRAWRSIAGVAFCAQPVCERCDSESDRCDSRRALDDGAAPDERFYSSAIIELSD